ncbi:hypothetical protein [Streptomyces sp. H27-D2]|uniref:hypothetical protein n=1 Tax=Streptomyces sp. H27-D2 TaxID=3046304 RepID=UPI002DBA5860|nr:hypothetical protein [Streptomyces sp. H27-D2]MEC4019903.1 hypothetical protein [Streptomyces sp. H27-D2]
MVKLGMVLDNIRKRADKLTAQRRADLDALGMRWTTTTAKSIRSQLPSADHLR